MRQLRGAALAAITVALATTGCSASSSSSSSASASAAAPTPAASTVTITALTPGFAAAVLEAARRLQPFSLTLATVKTRTLRAHGPTLTRQHAAFHEAVAALANERPDAAQAAAGAQLRAALQRLDAAAAAIATAARRADANAFRAATAMYVTGAGALQRAGAAYSAAGG